MESLRSDVIRIVCDELEGLKGRIIARHEAAGQVASGATCDSLVVEETEDGAILWGRQAFGVLETGRKSGKVPKGFYKIIEQWMEDKGIKVNRPKSFAYLVARKIASEGTRLFRSGHKEDIYSSDMEDTIEVIMSRILRVFDAEVEHINLNFNEEERV